MNTWTVAEAKAKFSEVISKANSSGPQTITKNGHTAVVIVSSKDWQQQTVRHGNLAEFFGTSPLVGSNLKTARIKGHLRKVEL